MSSSDDDFSLFSNINRPATGRGKVIGTQESQEEGSPEPDWLKSQEKPKAATDVITLESDSDGEPARSPPRKPAEPAVETKRKPPADSKSSPKPKRGSTGAPKEPDSPDDQPIGQISRLKVKAAAAKAGDAGAQLPSSQQSSQVQPSQPSQQTGDESTQEPLASQQAVKGEVTVMLPEKLNSNKILLELEDKKSADGLSSADLSGDAGAVGRLLATSGPDGRQDLQVDLKGALYNATLVEAPGTMCIVSVGVTDAKLREESTLAMAEALMEGDLDFMDDDDDVPDHRDKSGNASGEATAGNAAGGGKSKGKGGKGAKAKESKKQKQSQRQPKQRRKAPHLLRRLRAQSPCCDWGGI